MALQPDSLRQFFPVRRTTRAVCIGAVAVGGQNPLRIQSMTNTNTLDTEATVAQIAALAQAGCEIVRLAVPSSRDAENLAAIRERMTQIGVDVPLVADIHFAPKIALIAVEHVEKIRINPGNYADRKHFEVREYSDAEYSDEIARVAEMFLPLVRRCKELRRALRIGTNHGSLSDRILNRFGDTPKGMVESALEFLDVCEAEKYFDVIFSMKASNPRVMIHAYRLLAAQLAARAQGQPSYPFHLGVTEAGDGEDGRIKSAIGIGALLEDGIGDTIRVSLTESPVAEVPVAKLLAHRYAKRWSEHAADADVQATAVFAEEDLADSYSRRATRVLPRWTGTPTTFTTRKLGADAQGFALGGENPVRVEIAIGKPPRDLASYSKMFHSSLLRTRDLRCEGIVVAAASAEEALHAEGLAHALLSRGLEVPLALQITPNCDIAPSAQVSRWIVVLAPESEMTVLRALRERAQAAALPIEWRCQGTVAQIQKLADQIADLYGTSTTENFLVSVDSAHAISALRALLARLRARGFANCPAVLHEKMYALPREAAGSGHDARLLDTAIDLGAPLSDGIGDAIVLDGALNPNHALNLGYRILQAARSRISRAEFVSCPSCGRTLFDLEEVTARIKVRTGHLQGVSIAIMGCIVNGLGEMADADFGYVGSGPGKINLYVGKELVLRNVDQVDAEDRLVELIRSHGRWIDPPTEAP